MICFRPCRINAGKTMGVLSRLVALVVLTASATGCANLEAVRDFAGSSAKLTSYKDVTLRYVDSSNRRLLEIPDTDIFAAEAASIKETSADMKRQKDDLLKLHNAATGYMAALASLAGDETFDISGDIDKVVGSIAAIPKLGITEAHAKAFSGIAQKVVSWILAAKQSNDVRTMVKTYGADMDQVLEAMELAAKNYVGVLSNEASSIHSYQEARQAAWAPTAEEKAQVNSRRLLVVSLADRSARMIAKESADAVEAAKGAGKGVTTVRDGHKEMLKNVDRLEAKDVVALLKKAAADLKEIRANLKKL